MTCDPQGLKEVTLQKLNQEAQQRHALWQWEQKQRVMDKGAERHPWPLSRPCSDRAGRAGEEAGRREDGEAGGLGGGKTEGVRTEKGRTVRREDCEVGGLRRGGEESVLSRACSRG